MKTPEEIEKRMMDLDEAFYSIDKYEENIDAREMDRIVTECNTLIWVLYGFKH